MAKLLHESLTRFLQRSSRVMRLCRKDEGGPCEDGGSRNKDDSRDKSGCRHDLAIVLWNYLVSEIMEADVESLREIKGEVLAELVRSTFPFISLAHIILLEQSDDQHPISNNRDCPQPPLLPPYAGATVFRGIKAIILAVSRRYIELCRRNFMMEPTVQCNNFGEVLLEEFNSNNASPCGSSLEDEERRVQDNSTNVTNCANLTDHLSQILVQVETVISEFVHCSCSMSVDHFLEPMLWPMAATAVHRLLHLSPAQRSAQTSQGSNNNGSNTNRGRTNHEEMQMVLRLITVLTRAVGDAGAWRHSLVVGPFLAHYLESPAELLHLAQPPLQGVLYEEAVTLREVLRECAYDTYECAPSHPEGAIGRRYPLVNFWCRVDGFPAVLEP